ncbi:MAG: type II secretion system major pseudopilin GspG [Planctomycetaceae bacterium]|nr:type II secretion system major pseudopilin GspG [Planctomycetaceae bacterium]
MNRQPTQLRNRPSLRRGFTLVELLIVMAILVLLVSLVGPRLLGSKQKADVNAVKAQIGMFQAALERYAIDMNRFPTTEEGLVALVEDPSEMESDSETASSWDGPYLKQTALPKDPWNNNYAYEYPPTHGKGDLPEIWSYGPDGQEDTDDDIISWTGEGSDLDSESGGTSSRDSTAASLK